MIDLLFDIGPTVVRGMGEGPVDEQAIYYWSWNRNRRLSEFEIDTLKRMSAAYLQGQDHGEYIGSQAPFIDLTDEEKIEKRRAAEDNALAAFFNRGRVKK